MWTRSMLKSQAKMNLKSKYWSAFVVTLIISILGGGASAFNGRFSGGSIGFDSDTLKQMQDGNFQQYFTYLEDFFHSGLFVATIFLGVLAALIGVAFSVFVSSVVQVGGNRWFSRSRESAGAPSIGMIFSLFKAGSYLKTVGSMLWMNLFLFLWNLLASVPMLIGVIYTTVKIFQTDFSAWRDLTSNQAADLVLKLIVEFGPVLGLLTLASILLSIPYIIKTYSYRMTPWILADNPAIGYRRALQLSMTMTRGHKWNIFVLDLSFIGWYLLGFLACCIGTIFVIPYVYAVQAELFAVLRSESVASGQCTMEEFGYVKVAAPAPEAPANPVY